MSLADSLKAHIRTQGPISLADYMATCLLHPTDGYYSRGDAFGADGDFITAPEISQIFGEVIGATLAQHYDSIGAPDRVALVELGPGRGTLMADIVRTIGHYPEMAAATEVHFVEASPALRSEQKKRVPNAQWHDDLATLPPLPTLLVANEFFDALPIHAYDYVAHEQGSRWAERCIGLQAERLAYAHTAPGPQFAALQNDLPPAPALGACIELSPQSLTAMMTLSTHIAAFGGAAIIIDYGYDTPTYTPTFQAVKNHEEVDPLAEPGQADLTALVDFARLAATAREAGLNPAPVTGQGPFLMERGAGQRAQALVSAGADGSEVLAALKRLTAADQMGTLFKVLEIVHKKVRPS